MRAFGLWLASLVWIVFNGPLWGQNAPTEEAFDQFGIYAKTAPRAPAAPPVRTELPLQLQKGERIALLGNNLFDRMQHFGHFEVLVQRGFPEHQVTLRNLSWSADSPDVQPRPDNFGDWDQHLTWEKADVVLVAFGFNESFAGEEGKAAFRNSLRSFVTRLKSKAFNGESAARVILVSPIANENLPSVAAADRNNQRLKSYANAIQEIAAEQNLGYVDVFESTRAAMQNADTLTINGVHLNERGYELFARSLYEGIFGATAPEYDEQLRQAVLDKNRQYFRRFRPANTFYYTGGRNKSYGYLDFLPAMRNFDLMVANRDQRIWQIAQGKPVAATVDDSNIPSLPPSKQSRGANRWMSAADEKAEFTVDPRFEVSLFAGEEEFPDLAAPIQMRWDARGRLWVSCSTTYPHVYPGQEPNDKLVILEDTDGDGKADRSQVFADDLHIPLSFEFGDGGVYVSEMPHLTFLKDTDGDGRADERKILLSGFGTEDSHHALHDMTWTPDGDLIFRESIFHHSQIETPYGPVRQQNSGWFRFQPRDHSLRSFGSYHSTNPWGVTFDDWGQHLASHPIFASAFHALDPPYPKQHPRPVGLQAYSGVCGQEFVDFDTFPEELKGSFIKVRYKPTNRIEIHKWREYEFGYREEYQGDLVFSSNLSFIPVDIRFGPRGALYVCDWYNPVKGHAQYSLRDDRRDRHSGRIWRITTKGKSLQEPPQVAGAAIDTLLDLHKRPEYRYRYWAKRELRARNRADVLARLDAWVKQLDAGDSRFRHHQVEAMWLYRNLDAVNVPLWKELLSCEEHHARAAATRQLRYWHHHLPDLTATLESAATDANGLVRLEAVIAASYIGTRDSLTAILRVYDHPLDGHLAYAVSCALGSHTLRRHWENEPESPVPQLISRAARKRVVQEPTPSASQAQFDAQPGLKFVKVGCLPERMRFSVDQITARIGQPLKILFTNEDATDHNMVFTKPGALAEVGMAANEMARNPKNARSNFVPRSKRHLILQSSPMIGPTRKSRVHVFRFQAPAKPGIYPFVCTFPGHWVIMKGDLIVGSSESEIEQLIASQKPTIVKEWKLADFPSLTTDHEEAVVMRGLEAFRKSGCHQCHQMNGHGINLGPDLTEVAKRHKGRKLLQQILEPSTEVHEKYRVHQYLMADGRLLAGVLKEETTEHYVVVPNLLLPDKQMQIRKADVDEQILAQRSPMPDGLLNMLTESEIIDLVSFLEAGGYKVPSHLKKKHHNHK